MSVNQPVVHHLSDYRPPVCQIESVNLEFDLHPRHTRVVNRMQIVGLAANTPLVLAGEELTLLGVYLNGEEVTERCEVSSESLTVKSELANFELTVVTEISPETNTSLDGLYRSSGNYCTQCEAEGFRKITYFLDRPDVLTLFTTKIVADRADNRVLLSNGNLVESGELEDGRHYAIWQDPFKKPSYLFALVAGNLEYIEDRYRAADGRDITLKIYVEPQNIDQCRHAMDSLKKAMQWDEERFGLIYDLDIYMIVAVDDFNMGAMENKGLNIFNSKFVLAKPETASDVDYEGIESVIAHEYFHNWTGNRVTCRDWFQLTLKEGLTVFRDQEFTADMLSPAVKRIEDVKHLRTYQFPEDSGPMAHPIQPQSYIEMNNFYTMTVYEKGAEVVRLYHTLLGEEGFQKGMRLYFDRHDGQAVTVEDFRAAMADANGVDLSQMHHWYVQHGTPQLQVKSEYDAQRRTYTLSFKQSLAKQEAAFQPLLIPVKMGLISSSGEAMALKPAEGQESSIWCDGQEALLTMTESQQRFVFEEVAELPVPSLLRGFSAPVHLDYAYTDSQLSLLSRADKDPFVRWESFQNLALNEIHRNIKRFERQEPVRLSDALLHAFQGVLADYRKDPALTALTTTLPDLTYIAEQYETVNVEAVYEVHQAIRRVLAETFRSDLEAMYHQMASEEGVYRYDKADMARRKLKGVCLEYLMQLDDAFELGEKQFKAQHNMTDVMSALRAIVHTDHPHRADCLQAFYEQWHHQPLVLDKWFALQAASHHRHALEHVKELVEHPDFRYENPNRVRSVLGVFGRINFMGFHRADGAGYDFLADQVLKLDRINPQVAARLVAPFTQWKRYDLERQKLMKAALDKIYATPGLSKDVFEIVSKSLKS